MARSNYVAGQPILGRMVARYRAPCPNCGELIHPGMPIARYVPTGQKRPRWKHDDCDSIPVTLYDNPAAHSGNGDVAAELPADIQEQLAELARLTERVKALEEQDPVPREITIRRPDGTTGHVEGHVHPAFEEVLELATARVDVFLPGPSGCGKSHLAKQIAEALGLRFGSISCSAGMSEAQLLGRLVPAGENGQFVFLPPEFLECYENGGVFLMDELDAADANVLLVINSALANGYLSVPARHDKPRAERHPDFVCIAAANTFGHGADRQYVGRNQLDEATLDRFRIGTVPMDYDDSLERALCPSAELYRRLKRYRERVRENRLNRVVSTRFMVHAYKMVAGLGWTMEQVDAKLFAGWREDEVLKVQA